MATVKKATDALVELKEGDNTINGTRPGSSIPSNDEYTFEKLGNLMEFVPTTLKEEEEGSGEWMTVLADYVSGKDGQPLFQGQVRRLSQFVTNYAPDDVTKANVLRLLQIEAIRKSTREETAAGVAHVTVESESPEVKAERAKRIIAEDKLAALERQMTQNATTPTITNPTETTKIDGIEDEDWGEDGKAEDKK